MKRWYGCVLSAEEEHHFAIKLTPSEYQTIKKFILASRGYQGYCGRCDITANSYPTAIDAELISYWRYGKGAQKWVLSSFECADNKTNF